MKKELKTSSEWYEEIPKEYGFIIYDPDGWDRSDYQYSFFEELITKDEFFNRIAYSTCLSDGTEPMPQDFWSEWLQQ